MFVKTNTLQRLLHRTIRVHPYYTSRVICRRIACSHRQVLIWFTDGNGRRRCRIGDKGRAT